MKIFVTTFALVLGTAAVAQTSTPMADSTAAAKVSSADMKKITRCKAMTHDAMMKNETCAKMVKLHPAAFEYNPMVN